MHVISNQENSNLWKLTTQVVVNTVLSLEKNASMKVHSNILQFKHIYHVFNR